MKPDAEFILLIASFLLIMGSQPERKVFQQNTLSPAQESNISYTLKHPLHTVNGVSTSINSQLVIVNGKQLQQVKVTVPLRSFDSGNRARDRDMLKVTEADQHPEVIFVSTDLEEQNGGINVSGLLTFHGVTREIRFKAHQQWQNDNLFVEGSFTISLEEFKMQRPALLTMKVKDDLQVHFSMVYQ